MEAEPCAAMDALCWRLGGVSETRQHLLLAGRIREMPRLIKFQFTHRDRTGGGAAHHGNKPLATDRIERGTTRKSHVPDVIKQVVARSYDRVHILTPRYPAVAHAA